MSSSQEGHVGRTRFLSMFALLVYSMAGAGMFMALEAPQQGVRKENRREMYGSHRRIAIERILHTVMTADLEDLLLPNNSTNSTSPWLSVVGEVLDVFGDDMTKLHRCHAELKWDFGNAMLYCWTIVTTIGYGHIYPHTVAGKVATMLYSLVGIPLMLIILTDLGKLLTRLMKLPWFVSKLLFRRLSRCFCRRSLADLQAAEASDRAGLEVFDLPIPVAIGIVVAWIFICSAIQMIWERDWDYLVAFYFFFISLTTIGLGDIVPTQPHFLLLMFANILIGLSLLSMVINLIHSRIEEGYVRASERRSRKRGGRTDKSVSFYDDGRPSMIRSMMEKSDFGGLMAHDESFYDNCQVLAYSTISQRSLAQAVASHDTFARQRGLTPTNEVLI